MKRCVRFLGTVAIVMPLCMGWSSEHSYVGRAESSKTAACSDTNYRQFDFWLGDWDVFDFDNPKVAVAHVRVDRLLEGCVLQEQYEDTDGHAGRSLSIYDSARKVWHQTWMTNRGQLLVIEGKFEAGSMTMSGVEALASGQERMVRGMWKPVPGGVRETAVRSIDGGKTWEPWFDLMFRPTKTTRNEVR